MRTKGGLELPRLFLLLIHFYQEGPRAIGTVVYKKHHDFKSESLFATSVVNLVAMNYLILEKGGDIKKYHKGRGYSYMDKRKRFYSITPKGAELAKKLERYLYDSTKLIQQRENASEKG